MARDSALSSQRLVRESTLAPRAHTWEIHIAALGYRHLKWCACWTVGSLVVPVRHAASHLRRGRVRAAGFEQLARALPHKLQTTFIWWIDNAIEGAEGFCEWSGALERAAVVRARLLREGWTDADADR